MFETAFYAICVKAGTPGIPASTGIPARADGRALKPGAVRGNHTRGGGCAAGQQLPMFPRGDCSVYLFHSIFYVEDSVVLSPPSQKKPARSDVRPGRQCTTRTITCGCRVIPACPSSGFPGSRRLLPSHLTVGLGRDRLVQKLRERERERL